MGGEKKKRYTIKKDGRVIDETDCVLWARSMAEREKAQLWRNHPDHSYMVTDYGVGRGE